MRVLVAGCGDLGGALGMMLREAGHDVFGLRRRADALPPAIRPIAADLARAGTLAAIPHDIDAIVYTAGATDASGDAYRAAYVAGVTNLLALLRERAETPRFLFVSSTGVYPQHDGEWVDETSPTPRSGTRSDQLLVGETLVIESGLPHSVLRLAGIYGPGRTRLIDSVRSSRARIHEDPPLWTNQIRRDDAARALHHLLGLARPASLYVGVDDEPATEGDVLRFIASRLRVPPPPVANEPSPRGAGKRVDGSRLRATGFTPRFPTYREGYGELLESSPA